MYPSLFFYTIGALFESSSDPSLELAFRYSMKMVQANRMVLPRSRLSRVPSGSNNGDFLPPDDSFTAGKKGFYLFRI